MSNYDDYGTEAPETKCALAQIGRRILSQIDVLGSREAAARMNLAASRLGVAHRIPDTIQDADVAPALLAWCVALEVNVIVADAAAASR
jgi:hypothetical protein